jgi:hypothetical protein
MKLHGFLYGHYDSRGGATFIEADTQPEADAVYAKAFMHKEVWPNAPKQVEEADKQVCGDDYLGTATVEANTPIENGQDIEYVVEDPTPGPSLWVKETTTPGAFYPEHYELVLSEKCPDGFVESSLGEDAFGVIVILKGFDSFGDKR